VGPIRLTHVRNEDWHWKDKGHGLCHPNCITDWVIKNLLMSHSCGRFSTTQNSGTSPFPFHGILKKEFSSLHRTRALSSPWWWGMAQGSLGRMTRSQRLSTQPLLLATQCGR
jgi:hypothetical protein